MLGVRLEGPLTNRSFFPGPPPSPCLTGNFRFSDDPVGEKQRHEEVTVEGGLWMGHNLGPKEFLGLEMAAGGWKRAAFGDRGCRLQQGWSPLTSTPSQPHPREHGGWGTLGQAKRLRIARRTQGANRELLCLRHLAFRVLLGYCRSSENEMCSAAWAFPT